jgi:hypothetical protein
MKTRIQLTAGIGGFAEDKDYARELRKKNILPSLDKGERISLDFRLVKYATQSFIHALIGEALKKHGEEVLDRIEFQQCTPQIQSVIELVVDYSLGGFPTHIEGSTSAG